MYHDGVTIDLPRAHGRSDRALQAALEREVPGLLGTGSPVPSGGT
jgi:hypothetical protein